MIKNLYYKFRFLLKNLKKDHVSEYSAQCAYYTILSFIPFVILLITMVQYTGLEQQTVVNAIMHIIPENMRDVVLGVVQEIYSKSIGTISISIIFILWPAGKGLYALTKGFQDIYNINNKIKTNYFYLRFKAIIQTIMFVVLISMALTILVFGSSIISVLQEYFKNVSDLGTIYMLLERLGLVIVTFIIFLLLYKFIPRRDVSFKDCVIGAICGSISLNVVSLVFSVYLDIFKGFSITYGSLTTLILIMMWTYACFYTVFLGAEINKLRDNKKDNE